MRASGRYRVPPFLVAAGILLGAGGSAAAQQTVPIPERISVQLGAAKEKLYDASRVARHYLGYAVLAARAYDRFGVVDGRKALTTDPAYDATLPKPLRLTRADTISIGGRSWTLADGREGCATPENCWARSGLGVHFWKRQSRRTAGRCTEVVLAFRGTHGALGSVFSNIAPLSVFVRILMPGADHYEQVRLNVDSWISDLRKLGCQNARIVAVGHSLGGGLARHAAYQNSRISRVYTFNTSPVAAWSFVDQQRRERNVKGLEIENVVERGELLSVVRAPFAWWSPPKSCDPQERTIMIDGVRRANALAQHGIWPMAAQFHDWESRGRGVRRREAGLPQLTLQEKKALNCIITSREHYMANNDPDWIAERNAGPTITVRPTPQAVRER
jgi:hypothetical protein